MGCISTVMLSNSPQQGTALEVQPGIIFKAEQKR